MTNIPQKEMNYYELFEITPNFDIDLSALRKKYFLLSKLHHPDNFSTGLAIEQEAALQITEQINEAYKTLLTPALNMDYYLSMNGYIDHGEKYNLSPDFLMEMMDENELFLDLKNKGNSLQLEIEKLRFKKMHEDLHRKIISLASEKVDKTALKDLYYRAKYVKRLLSQF
jgi:molecular chaperone HscB